MKQLELFVNLSTPKRPEPPKPPPAPLEPDDWPFQPGFNVHPVYRLQVTMDLGNESKTAAEEVPVGSNLIRNSPQVSSHATDAPDPAYKIVSWQQSVETLLRQESSAGCEDPTFLPPDATYSDDLLVALIRLAPVVAITKSRSFFEVIRGNDLLRHAARRRKLGLKFTVPVILGELGFLYVLATSILAAALWAGVRDRARFLLSHPDEVLRHYRVGRESLIPTVARATGLTPPTVREIAKDLAHGK
jgi:hypothetical protein